MPYSKLATFRSPLIALTTALTPACVPEPIGDGTDSSTATTTPETADDPTLGATSIPPTTGPTSTDATDTTDTTPLTTTTDDPSTTETGPAPQCPGVRAFQCTDPIDCTAQPCGDPFSPFDADGCMRPPCTQPEDCEPGTTCLHAQDYGGCESSGLFCQDGKTGTCECVSTPDCSGGHCLPDAEVPPLDCLAYPDEKTCLDSGCNWFETVTEISDTCECTPGVPACLLFIGGIGGAAAPNYFWHEATSTVALFSTDWIELPVGWRRCTDAGAPPACDCYEPFMDPMCP